MTICIGALAEKSKKLVLASDKMITASIPITYEFEKDDVQKIYSINDDCKILTAGNALTAYEIIEEVKKIIDKQKVDSNATKNIEEISELVRITYQNYRRNFVIQRFLEPRGLNLTSYYQNQKNLNPGIVQEIENALVNFSIGVDLLIAGRNLDEICHLYSVIHPGTLSCHDALGYTCLGSGAPHALYSLIASQYTKDKNINDVKLYVEEAKRRSEVAPGVGNKTEVILIPNIE
jgi:20S proteasome alpha/beta subunit